MPLRGGLNGWLTESWLAMLFGIPRFKLVNTETPVNKSPQSTTMMLQGETPVIKSPIYDDVISKWNTMRHQITRVNHYDDAISRWNTSHQIIPVNHYDDVRGWNTNGTMKSPKSPTMMVLYQGETPVIKSPQSTTMMVLEGKTPMEPWYRHSHPLWWCYIRVKHQSSNHPSQPLWW